MTNPKLTIPPNPRRRTDMIRHYPKFNGTEAERGFTAEEIRRGIHNVYADYECPECGRAQPMAAGHLCQRCGFNYQPTGKPEVPHDRQR